MLVIRALVLIVWGMIFSSCVMLTDSTVREGYVGKENALVEYVHTLRDDYVSIKETNRMEMEKKKRNVTITSWSNCQRR